MSIIRWNTKKQWEDNIESSNIDTYSYPDYLSCLTLSDNFNSNEINPRKWSFTTHNVVYSVGSGLYLSSIDDNGYFRLISKNVIPQIFNIEIKLSDKSPETGIKILLSARDRLYNDFVLLIQNNEVIINNDTDNPITIGEYDTICLVRYSKNLYIYLRNGNDITEIGTFLPTAWDFILYLETRLPLSGNSVTINEININGRNDSYAYDAERPITNDDASIYISDNFTNRKIDDKWTVITPENTDIEETLYGLEFLTKNTTNNCYIYHEFPEEYSNGVPQYTTIMAMNLDLRYLNPGGKFSIYKEFYDPNAPSYKKTSWFRFDIVYNNGGFSCEATKYIDGTQSSIQDTFNTNSSNFRLYMITDNSGNIYCFTIPVDADPEYVGNYALTKISNFYCFYGYTKYLKILKFQLSGSADVTNKTTLSDFKIYPDILIQGSKNLNDLALKTYAQPFYYSLRKPDEKFLPNVFFTFMGGEVRSSSMTSEEVFQISVLNLDYRYMNVIDSYMNPILVNKITFFVQYNSNYNSKTFDGAYVTGYFNQKTGSYYSPRGATVYISKYLNADKVEVNKLTSKIEYDYTNFDTHVEDDIALPTSGFYISIEVSKNDDTSYPNYITVKVYRDSLYSEPVLVHGYHVNDHLKYPYEFRTATINTNYPTADGYYTSLTLKDFWLNDNEKMEIIDIPSLYKDRYWKLDEIGDIASYSIYKFRSNTIPKRFSMIYTKNEDEMVYVLFSADGETWYGPYGEYSDDTNNVYTNSSEITYLPKSDNNEYYYIVNMIPSKYIGNNINVNFSRYLRSAFKLKEIIASSSYVSNNVLQNIKVVNSNYLRLGSTLPINIAYSTYRIDNAYISISKSDKYVWFNNIELEDDELTVYTINATDATSIGIYSSYTGRMIFTIDNTDYYIIPNVLNVFNLDNAHNITLKVIGLTKISTLGVFALWQ